MAKKQNTSTVTVADVLISKEAETSTVAKVHTKSLDPSGLLSDLKPTFMKACTRMYGDERKYNIMKEFLALAQEIALHQFQKQKARREAK